MSQLYVDMDGVLADFEQHYYDMFGIRIREHVGPGQHGDVDWDAVRETGDFFAEIPPMVDFPQLWQHVSRYDPIILTAIPYSIGNVAEQKQQWVSRHIGPHTQVIPVVGSRNKARYCRVGDVLIDDYTRYQHLWIEAGGRWITHVSAQESIDQLRQLEGFHDY